MRIYGVVHLWISTSTVEHEQRHATGGYTEYTTLGASCHNVNETISLSGLVRSKKLVKARCGGPGPKPSQDPEVARKQRKGKYAYCVDFIHQNDINGLMAEVDYTSVSGNHLILVLRTPYSVIACIHISRASFIK